MNIRQLFLCLFCFFIQHILLAQPINRSLHLQPINIADKLLPTTINGAWLIGGSAGQYMGYPAFLPWLGLADASGNLIWERYLNDAEAVELGQVNSLCEDAPGRAFYVAGAVSGCDYLIPGFFYMLDENGQTLWYRSSEPFYNPVAAALPLQGALLAEKGAGLVEWRSMSGDIVLSYDFSDEFSLQLVEMLTIGPNKVALLGNNQLILTEWADGEMEVAARISLPDADGKSISLAPSGRLAVAGGNKAYLLDEGLNLLQEQDLSAYGSFSKVSCGAGRCYFGGQSPEGAYIALATDAGLNLLQTIDMGPNYNFPADLAAREGGLLALGHTLPHETATEPYASLGLFATTLGSDIFLRSWDAEGKAAPSQRDIAVEEIAIGQHDVETGEDFCYPSGPGYMQGSFAAIEVKVRNRGAAAIDRIQLNAVFQPCWFICYTQQNISRTFSGLSLGPGEGATLSFGNVQTWPLPLQNNFELCIWASGPDGQLDENFGDNSACAGLLVSDVEEPEAFGGVKLFPNPASDVLEVRLERPLSDEATVEVLSLVGQSLCMEVLNRGQAAARLQVSRLPAGVYYLKIQDEKGAVARPWVKE